MKPVCEMTATELRERLNERYEYAANFGEPGALRDFAEELIDVLEANDHEPWRYSGLPLARGRYQVSGEVDTYGDVVCCAIYNGCEWVCDDIPVIEVYAWRPMPKAAGRKA